MHWNVDYFRELAPIGEVWYGYTQSEQMEHDWASAVSNMHGDTVPVQGFGAMIVVRVARLISFTSLNGPLHQFFARGFQDFGKFICE